MYLKKIPALLLLLVLPACVALAQTDPGVYARIETTKGTMLFLLDTENTPATAANFIGLAEGNRTNEARSGVPFYDGLLFFTVINKYAIFSGDPVNNGEGGPGYTLPRENNPSLSAENRGTLMMSGMPRATHGSQFFIMNGSDKFLDTKNTPFGMIVEGLTVLDKMTDDDTIMRVTILRVGEEASGFAVNEDQIISLIDNKLKAELDALRTSAPALVSQIEALGADRQRSLTGIWFLVQKEGTGAKVRAGQTAVVHYKGMLLDGKVFDSSYERGQPLELAVGIQPMIPGWMEALMSMNKGEKRRIIIPPELAYGKQGYGPIGPDSWLVFELELIEIR